MPPPAPDCMCASLAHPSFILTERPQPARDLSVKWLTRKERCLPAFFFFSSPVSLWIPFCQRFYYARNVQWQRNPLVNHSLLMLFWQTAFTNACLCWDCLALLPAPGERGVRATEHLSLGHRVPKSPLPTNPLIHSHVGFQSFCHHLLRHKGRWQMRRTTMFAIETGDLILLGLWKYRSATAASCCVGRENKCPFQENIMENKCNLHIMQQWSWTT